MCNCLKSIRICIVHRAYALRGLASCGRVAVVRSYCGKAVLLSCGKVVRIGWLLPPHASAALASAAARKLLTPKWVGGVQRWHCCLGAGARAMGVERPPP